MDNERSALRSNKEFSSELQETNDFDTTHPQQDEKETASGIPIITEVMQMS